MVKNRISSQYVFGYQKFILYPEDYKATKSGKKKVLLPELVGKGYGTFWRWKGRYRVCKGSRASKKSKTSLTSVLIPGEDEEDTEVFRQRYFDSFNEQSFGGNHADYMAKVKSIEGVGSCKVKRVWNGDIRPADMIVSTVVKNWYESIISTVPAAVKPWLDAVYNAAKDKKLTVGGTVHVVITDSDDYGEASSTLVQYVQQTLDPEENAGEGYGLAPIGHVVSVASASPVSIEVKTTVTFEEGHNWSNTKAAVAEAVDAYFLELRKNWSETSQTIVRVSQIENRILGVDGVVDVTGTKLNGTASNMTLTEFCIPKLGGVSA